MNKNQIEAFLTTVRLKSISKAANSLFVSQSTISQRIHAIEKDYKIILLNRERGVKKITLTSNGEKFYQLAIQFEALLSEAKNLETKSRETTITIGAVDSIHNYIFEHIYKYINDQLPNIRLSIRTYQSNEIYSLIEDRKIDIGFPLQERILRNIKVKPLFNEQLVLIHRNNQVINSKIICNNSLSPENQIYINWGREYQIWHEKYWGSSENTFMQVDTLTMLNELLTDSKYWAIVPISIARVLLKMKGMGIAFLKEAPPDRVCYLVERDDADINSRKISEMIVNCLPLAKDKVKQWRN